MDAVSNMVARDLESVVLLEPSSMINMEKDSEPKCGTWAAACALLAA